MRAASEGWPASKGYESCKAMWSAGGGQPVEGGKVNRTLRVRKVHKCWSS